MRKSFLGTVLAVPAVALFCAFIVGTTAMARPTYVNHGLPKLDCFSGCENCPQEDQHWFDSRPPLLTDTYVVSDAGGFTTCFSQNCDGCATDADHVADQLEGAIKDSRLEDVLRIEEARPDRVVFETQRDVIDLIDCNGKSVVATIAIPADFGTKLALAKSQQSNLSQGALRLAGL